jgi:hypothetical protein
MSRVSDKLRRVEGGYAHWCPGCGEHHKIPDSWDFNGDVEVPTFSPSVRITGVQTVQDSFGRWTGEWVYGPDGKALPYCCHYFLTRGMLLFCADSTHALAGQTVPLPGLPEPHGDE